MIRILQGDSRDQLIALESESVQCVVTSPPYDNLRTYNGCEWDFEATAMELQRVLCKGGVICWNVGDAVINGSETLTAFRQALWFKEIGFRVHDTMIWHKPNFSNPEKVRYHQLFEYIFILSKGAPRVFNPIKDKPNKYPNGPWGKNTYRLRNGEMKLRKCAPTGPFGMRGNVWNGNTVGQESPTKVVHPAMMPLWLAKDLIRSWSNPGDIVCDPFAGSGTTGLAALELDRNALLIEINPAYVELIKQRCRKPEQMKMKSKKRFSNEQQILDAIDECHSKAKAYTLEANQCDIDAQAYIKRAHEIEQETIALSAFKALPSPLVAVETECARWHLSPPLLAAHLHDLGVNEDELPLASLRTDTLRWVCQNWPRILQFHIGHLRRIAGEKLKLAKRRRIGADNQVNGKAVMLGELLAVMRTQPMEFLSETNRAGKKEGDYSIPAL